MDETFLNVVDTDVDKSTILVKVLQTMAVDRKQVFVFGDDNSDLSMMRLGGVSVAMANAKSEVKAVGD